VKYQRILTEIYRTPWAILPEKLATITEIVSLRAAGEKISKEEIRERLKAFDDEHGNHLEARQAGNGGGQDFGVVALIPIYGVISHRMNLLSEFSGGTSVERITKSFRQALADPGVKAIVFDINSPGGNVDGVPELADEIMQSRGKKKIVAVANGMAASAAYWIAAAADEVVVIPSGQVGSIGIFVAHEDISAALEQKGIKVSLISAGKYKIDGNPYEPLSDEAKADLQDKVNAFYEMFVKSVAKGRGVAQAKVRGGFGEGHLVLASDAAKEKMVDRVETLDQTLARMGVTGSPRKMAAAAPPAAVQADVMDGECMCSCGACEGGNCEDCTNDTCDDAVCAASGCPNQASAKAAAALSRRKRELALY
jgi:signal peptide peptidase SppA